MSAQSLFISILAILAIFILFFMVKEFTQRKKDTATVASPYKFSAFYTKDDFVEILEELAKEESFQVYFDTLTPQNISVGMKEIFEFLDKNRGEKPLKSEVLRRQVEIEALALSFSTLSFSEEFFQAPLEHEELGQALWTFVIEEFKATVLAFLYKENYDGNFIFNWKDKETLKETGQKIRGILQKLSPEQKRAMGDVFTPP